MTVLRLTTADHWKKMVTSVAGKTKTGYLVFNNISAKSTELAVCKPEDLKKSQYQKLSLDDITQISQRLLVTNEDSKTVLAIVEGVELIAAAKAERLNSLIRIFARAVQYLLFATILGIPLGCLIKDVLDAPEEEIERAKDLRKQVYLKKVDAFIKNEDKTHLAAYIRQNVPETMKDFHSESQMLVQFEKDHKRRGTGITLIDGPLYYNTEGLQDPEKNEAHLKEQFGRVQKLVSNDQRWLKPLQGVLTQVIGIGLTSNLKKACNMAGSYIGDPFAPERFGFEERSTQIQVKVIREKGRIAQLQVTATTISDLYHEKQSKDMIGMVKSKVNFVVTLNSSNEPVFSRFNHRHLSLC